MKKQLLLALCFIPNILVAQIALKNLSLKHPDSSLLYIGASNCIKIVGLKDLNHLELKAKKGTVSTFENGDFFVKEVSNKLRDTLILYQDKKILLSKIYEIKYISDPIAQLGYITTEYATVNQILLNTKLSVVLPNCDLKHYLSITSFELSLYSSKNVLLANWEYTSSNELSPIQIEEIKKLHSGAKLKFENLKARSPDCIPRALNDLTITIK